MAYTSYVANEEHSVQQALLTGHLLSLHTAAP